MRHEDLPERWQKKLRDYLHAKSNTTYERLGASEFVTSNTVHIRFEDDSKIEFRYAFVIAAPEFREMGVFTEHCGYHLFQSYDGLDVVIKSHKDASAGST